MKRVVIISDLHSGHVVGLTHPSFDVKHDQPTIIEQARAEYWQWFASRIDALRPIHVLIVNGDCIEGKGEKSGGTELIETDRNEQVKMAAAAIKFIGAEKVYMSYGTPYHTGASEDFEDSVAQQVEAVKIGSHDWLDVNGLVFDYRHFISGSQIPHGRFTALASDRLWNLLWNEHGEYPKSDVIIRSHVHYYSHCDGVGWDAFITPALQGSGSKYGARKMKGTVDFGFLSFDVEDKTRWSYKKHILKRSRSAAVVMKA